MFTISGGNRSNEIGPSRLGGKRFITYTISDTVTYWNIICKLL